MSSRINRIEEEDADHQIEDRLLMLRPTEDEINSTPAAETNIELGNSPVNTATPGPQSPPVESERPKSVNANKTQNRKQQFVNMTSKIQIIPNNRQGQLNTTFLATLPGVLKIAEIILCFVAFILAICSDRRSTSAAWTDHITFECMIVVSALLLGYVAFPHLTLKDEATREGLIVVELLFYGINTLFFFIAVFLMIHVSASWTADGRGAAVMGAIICVGLTLIFAIETFIKFKAWRGENLPTTKIINTGNSQTVPGQLYPTNAELNRADA
uniref:MARVEL domain-containing protein n=1 Tax=Panagrolaimus sp. JU765 TaxID=591449 RepID=A0AC34R434_9BILA